MVQYPKTQGKYRKRPFLKKLSHFVLCHNASVFDMILVYLQTRATDRKPVRCQREMRESEETQHPDQKEIMGRNQDKYRGGKTREKNEAVRNKEMKVHEEKLITISEELENRYKRNGSCTIGETQNGTIGDTQKPTEGEGIKVDEGSKGKTRKTSWG